MNSRILMICGPNLNMLGIREKEFYGNFTLPDGIALAQKTAESFGYTLDAYQTNHEGNIIDRIHSSLNDYDGMIINAGALTHYSYSILDALKLCPFPCVEFHISDIHSREDFRKISVIRPACSGQICGLGLQSFHFAVIHCLDLIENRAVASNEGRTDAKYHKNGG